MAKKSSVEKNKRRTALVKRFAAKRVKLKGTANNLSLPPEERFAARLNLAELPRNSSPNRYRNRCDLFLYHEEQIRALLTPTGASFTIEPLGRDFFVTLSARSG